MNKLIAQMNVFEIILVGIALIIFVILGYHYKYDGTKIVRAQKVDYNGDTYSVYDSTVEVIRVDTNYKIGDIYDNCYRIIP